MLCCKCCCYNFSSNTSMIYCLEQWRGSCLRRWAPTEDHDGRPQGSEQSFGVVNLWEYQYSIGSTPISIKVIIDRDLGSDSRKKRGL